MLLKFFQVVVDSSVATPSRLVPTGTCLLVEGQLERAEGKHAIELKAEKVLHIGTVDFDKYPLSKKRIPLDTLRDYSQFRPRTTTVKLNITFNIEKISFYIISLVHLLIARILCTLRLTYQIF